MNSIAPVISSVGMRRIASAVSPGVQARATPRPLSSQLPVPAGAYGFGVMQSTPDISALDSGRTNRQHRAKKASMEAGVQDVLTEVTIRRFQEGDASPVRELFITINRQLSPPDMREAFESYIARSLAEEMDRVSAYYGERGGGFWVADHGGEIIGMFGLESAGPGSRELRRMYVAPSARRGGAASLMIRFAEDECRRSAIRKIELSTSELQSAAIELYKKAGYRLVREAVVADASNKTIGGGIRRFYFEKAL